MSLEEYYKIAINKKEKSITDILVIEIYNLKNAKEKKGENK